MSGRVAACPKCDAASVKSRSGAHPGRLTNDPSADRHVCGTCGATFDEPVYREAYTNGDPRQGLVKQLLEADPDDVGGSA